VPQRQRLVGQLLVSYFRIEREILQTLAAAVVGTSLAPAHILFIRKHDRAELKESRTRLDANVTWYASVSSRGLSNILSFEFARAAYSVASDSRSKFFKLTGSQKLGTIDIPNA